MTSQCKSITPLLSEYVDDALDTRRTSFVESHIRECKDCSQIVQEFRANKDLMASLAVHRTSTSFDDALARRIAVINAQAAERPWWKVWQDKPSIWNIWRDISMSTLRPVMATCALVIVAFAAFLLRPVQQFPPTPKPGIDQAFIDQCVSQHQKYVQTLTAQTDNTDDGDTDDDAG